MLIACQKFRLHMIGHYNRLCHIIMHNTHEMWGLIYLHNENSAYIMPCVTTHAVTSCTHHAVHTCKQAGCPYVNMTHQKLLMDMPFPPAKQYLSKLTSSHYSTLNMRIANQNMLERILIAMHNKNKADCNENFRICVEEPIAPLCKQ